jgi:PAS domain S-box-containing protein
MLIDQAYQQLMATWRLFPMATVAALLFTIGLLYLLSLYRSSRPYEAARSNSASNAAEGYFRSATEGLVIINAVGRIVRANARTEILFGYSEEELFGHPIEILVPERSREQLAAHRKQCLGVPGVAGPLELAARRKDGTEFPALINLTLMQTESGERLQFEDLMVVSIVNVAERLGVERETRRTDMLTALGAVVAGVAQELNEPLAVVCSRIELIRKQAAGMNLPAQLRDDLRVINLHAQRAGHIAQELLSLARERPRERMRALNLNELVDKMLLPLGEEMRKDPIRISTALDPDLPSVLGDPAALEQVLVNLLTNARDAMPDGGSVTIETGVLIERPGRLYLRVTDSGGGVSPESASKLFQLFYTTKSGGTGLGLWLCRRIAMEHWGYIDVSSEPGCGASFVLTLPILQPDARDRSRADGVPHEAVIKEPIRGKTNLF